MAFISIVKFAQEVLEKLFACWKTLNIDDDPHTKKLSPFLTSSLESDFLSIVVKSERENGTCVCGKALSFDYPSIIPHSNPFPALDNLLLSFINQLSIFWGIFRHISWTVCISIYLKFLTYFGSEFLELLMWFWIENHKFHYNEILL